MNSQRSLTLKRQTTAPRAFVAASLLVALLLTAAPAVFVVAAPASPQDRREAARKVFAEGERLREEGTAEAARAAVEKYQEAIRLMRAAGDQEGEGSALATLGFTFQFLLRRHEQAVAAYEQALAVFRGLGARREEGALLYNLGAAYLALGRYERAVESCERSLTVQRGLGDRSAEGRAAEGDAHGCLGEAHERLGRYEQAIESSSLALAINRGLGRREQQAVLLSNLGASYSSLGRYDLAAEHYRQALTLYRGAAPRAGGDTTARRNEGTTLANLGFALHKLGQLERAVEHYERALVLHRETADARQEANTLTKLALARLEQGRAEEAVETSRRALVVHRESKDRFGEGRALDVIGRAYRALGKTEQALEQLRASLAAMRETGARAGEAAALGELMLTYRARGATRLAVFYGKQSVNAYQDIRRDIRRLDRESREAFVGSKQDSYRTLAGLLVSQGRLAEAQQVLAMLKEDEYFEFVRRDGGDAAALTVRAALSPEEAAAERRYREIADRVAEIGRRWGALAAKESRTPEEARELAQLERDLEAANSAFQRFLDELSAELADTKQAGKVFQLREAEGLKDVLRELGGRAVVLYTIVGEEKYRVILFTPDAQLAREYPIRAADLYAKVLAFRLVLQDPRRDPLPLARELYRILVGPVAKDLEGAQAETLMWSLDGALRYIPVAALHDGERYMVERYRNVVFTPATQARLKDRPSAEWRALGFGVSKAHGDFAALPAVPGELRGIIRDESPAAAAPPRPEDARGVLPGRVLLDEAFTEDALRASLRERYPLVHIASHFAFQPGNETDSFLLLGDGTRLPLARIKSATNLFSGVELLTLSACDTATSGAGADGREVEGFAVLAQRQGAKAVVASLWPVADASTMTLMHDFYRLRGGQAGVSKAEALRQAQLSLLRGGAKSVAGEGERRGLTLGTNDGAQGRGLSAPRAGNAPYSHPYFWAPFILVGNWL